MTLTDLLLGGLSAMTAHKFRSALTLFGVTLGAMLLFCSISGGLGVIDVVNQRLAAGDRLLEIIVSSGLQTDEVTPEKAREAGFVEEMSDERRVRLARASGVGGARPVPMNLAASEALGKVKHVAAAWSRLRFTCTLFLADQDRWGQAVAYAVPPKLPDYSTILIAGEPLARSTRSEETSDDSAVGILVSELFLYQQGIRTTAELAAAIGRPIQINTRMTGLESRGQSIDEEKRQKLIDMIPFRSKRFVIQGVFRYPDEEELRANPDLALFGVTVMLPYDEATTCWQGLGLSANNTTAVVLAQSPEAVGGIEAAIGSMGYRTRSLAELAMQIRTAVLLISLIITAIAAAALLISALGITNTMVMNVLERRKDIAIMKSIGARDCDLRRMFLIEGFLMGLIGGLGGLILGWTMSKLCGDWIRIELETRLDEPLYGSVFAYPVWLIVATPVVAAIVTMLASYVPARRAAKIDPSQILRGL